MARNLARAARPAAALLNRTAMLVVALFAVMLAMALLPGNGVRALLGRDATETQVRAREAELGLDRPVVVRFWEWLSGLVRGDFGTTLRGEPVGDLLAAKVPNSLVLTGVALLVTVVVATLLAVYWTSGERPVFRRIASVGTIVVIALPEFVVATIAILVFALALDVLPAATVQDSAGAPRDPSMYILPVIALALPQIGWNTRVFVAAIREARSLPYVHAAELDGVGEAALFVRYIAPRALPTMIASLATTVGMIVGGSVVVESLFNFPGVGAVVAGSVNTRDVNVVAAVVACTGVVILLMLLLADATRAWAKARAE
ncbi:ABC transporter permease [Mycolicibacterium wolinskyi]|uniref:ABC transporter permease n=1 Tax=Mycolicibacterium wolinskyi TaxID=59750 RepID=UPI003917AE02